MVWPSGPSSVDILLCYSNSTEYFHTYGCWLKHQQHGTARKWSWPPKRTAVRRLWTFYYSAALKDLNLYNLDLSNLNLDIIHKFVSCLG